MKILPLVLALLALVPAVFAECDPAFDSMQITRDTILCNKAFDVPSGITIKTDGVMLDCNGAIIRGAGVQDGQGVIIDHADGVTVKNCNILNYDVGVYVKEGNRNRIVQNSLLKNRIGVRMLNAFENRFESNADKSILKPVSSIASKFNSFWLVNKELDRDFCAENMCNSAGQMNPCANDDFYCSPSCDYVNDNDCPALQVQEQAPIVEQPKAEPEKKAPEVQNLPAEPKNTAKTRATGEFANSLINKLDYKARFWTTAFLFIITYLIGFLCFQHHHWKHG